jgi:hypothetical protein
MTGIIRVHAAGRREVLSGNPLTSQRPDPGEMRIRQAAIGINSVASYPTLRPTRGPKPHLTHPQPPIELPADYLIAPAYDSLVEAFLKAEGRGTMAAFAPSGLSLDGPAHL